MRPSVARRLPLAGIVVLVVTLAVAAMALAGGGEKPRVRISATDQAAARVAVIRRSDLRPACCWTGGPTKPDLSPLTCANYHPKQSDLVVTGAAAARWESETYVEEDSEAHVLQTARMVRLDWERSIEAPGLTSCMRSTAIDGGYEGAGPVRRIAFPHIAPYATAFQVLLKGGVWGEFVAIGKGRTEIEVGVLRPTRESVSAEALRLARILVGRARA